MKQTITFDVERETKNAVRYQEDVHLGNEPFIGTLYVKKATFAEYDSIPQTIRVTIEVD